MNSNQTPENISAIIEGYRNGYPMWSYDITGEEWLTAGQMYRTLIDSFDCDDEEAESFLVAARARHFADS